MATETFPGEMNDRGTVKVADKILISNSDTDATEYTTVQGLITANVITRYWSCPGAHFDGLYPDTDDVSKNNYGALVIGADGVSPRCAVFLPNGATVTGAVVYGNAGAEDDTWYLIRETLATSTRVTVAGANVNTEDTSIDYATIDNSLYAYFIYITDLVTTDEIYGARITYTS